MTFSLFYDDPLVDPWWSHPSRSASLGIGLFSCFLFREMFPRRLDWIWIMEVTCLMIDDSISPDFQLIVHLMPHWGIFPFRGGLEISMELHDHSHSRSTCWDDDLFTIVMMITQWSILGVIQLGIHFSTLRCHRVPLSERCILAWWAWHCYGFVWSGLHICWCMIGRHLIFPTSHIWCHTGAYFLFRSGFAVSHLFVWLSLVTRYVSGWWFQFHFIVTLQGAFPWVVSSGSYSPMSLWFLDGIISGS